MEGQLVKLHKTVKRLMEELIQSMLEEGHKINSNTLSQFISKIDLHLQQLVLQQQDYLIQWGRLIIKMQLYQT